jgi:adenosylmethionine-8-amino-7-oxononanoate aminotransferase
MAPIENFYHLHTYGNHPVACAAALKNIEILRVENLVNNSKEMGDYFLAGLKNLERHAIVGEARGTGLWLALDLTTDEKTRAPFPMDRLGHMINLAKQHGLIIKAMGSALEFAPPLIITKADIDEALEILERCIVEEEKAMGL